MNKNYTNNEIKKSDKNKFTTAKSKLSSKKPSNMQSTINEIKNKIQNPAKNKAEDIQVLYIYDIEAKNKLQYGRIKRLFYYHLGKIQLKNHYWKTKSTLAVPVSFERILDVFFKKFSKSVVVYKAYIDAIEKL